MSKILIIKTGASGDVVRTTVLLHLFANDDVTWVTSAYNMALLPSYQPNLELLAIEDIDESRIFGNLYHLVISLDEDRICAELASRLRCCTLIGCYIADGQLTYTESAREWFDMGLISKYGKLRANELKWHNNRCYQQILFSMLGHTFQNEEYLVCRCTMEAENRVTIGIETRSGNRWPTKQWNGYAELAGKLAERGLKTTSYSHKKSLNDYVDDIAASSMVICGDTLCMHIALSLKKPVVGIFTCTSPAEIFGYGRLAKIVSPYLYESYYKTEYCAKAVEAISVEDVYQAIERITVSAQKNYTSVYNPA